VELLAAYSTSDATALMVAHGQSVPAGHSVWTQALLIAGVGAGLVAAVASVFISDRKLDRRIYWLGWVIATSCISLAVLPRGWPASLAIGLLGVFAAVVYAYLRTPFLKIRGRIYALSINDSRPDPPADEASEKPPSAPPRDSYPTTAGPVSARNLWWVLVVLTCLVSVGVYLVGWAWQMVLGAVLLAVLGGVFGVDDATRKLPMARGQHVQAFIVSVASILLWLAPPVCYFVGYGIGQRWPMGRGKHAAGHDPDDSPRDRRSS
jgi:hypothetical protein